MEQDKSLLHPLVIAADYGGCHTYRIKIPFTELKKYNVSYTKYPYLPNDPTRTQMDVLLNFVYPYDFVIVQRCTKLSIMWILRQVCDILGKKLVFETDDDYLHIPEHNPCWKEMALPGRMQEFAEILRIADLITVSTEELKNVYYPFNRNIVVLKNNVEEVHFFKDAGEIKTDEDGRYNPIFEQGFVNVPAYAENPDGGKHRMIRIGYTGTETHRKDFDTIKTTWFKTLKKLGKRVQVVYIGDKYFRDLHVQEMGSHQNMLWIPPCGYDLYYCNIRNLDIGIAPLESNIFNMSKSPIKAIEYGSWGIPAVLPNYVTYDREFQNEVNCLFYNNQAEFGEQMVRMVEDVDLRKKLGGNSRNRVAGNCVESIWSQSRFEAYQGLVNTGRPLKVFEVTKGKVNYDAKSIEEVSKLPAAAEQSPSS